MTYAELQTYFRSLLNRRDITATLAKQFLQQAIQRAQRTLRVPGMEVNFAYTVDDTYTKAYIPGDFLSLNYIYVEEGGLQKASLAGVRALARAETGVPRFFARNSNYWEFGPAPQAGTVITINYEANASNLVNDEDTNFLTDIAPDLIVYGALSYACDYYIDDRASVFEARFLQIIEELNMQANEEDLSGEPAIRPAYSMDFSDYPN